MNSGVRENSHVHIFSGRRKNSFILNCWTIKPYMSVLFWKWDRWTIYRHTSALCSILSFVCMSPAQHHLQFSHLDRHVSAVWTCLHSSYSHPESASVQPLYLSKGSLLTCCFKIIVFIWNWKQKHCKVNNKMTWHESSSNYSLVSTFSKNIS